MNPREWALPVYTILIQLATGALLMLWLIRARELPRFGQKELDRVIKHPVPIIFLTIVTAALGAHFHLSRPLLSLFALLNLTASWLSREILFTVFFFLLVGGLALLQWFERGSARCRAALGWSAIACGAATIFCMVLVYLLPTQPFWNSLLTPVSFYATMFLLGPLALFAMLVMDLRFSLVRDHIQPNVRALIIEHWAVRFAFIIIATAALIILLNFYEIFLLSNGDELARISLNLLMGLYKPLFIIRLGLLSLGVGWLAFITRWIVQKRKKASRLIGHVYMIFLMVLVSEILGRFLFYAIHVRLGIF